MYRQRLIEFSVRLFVETLCCLLKERIEMLFSQVTDLFSGVWDLLQKMLLEFAQKLFLLVFQKGLKFDDFRA